MIRLLAASAAILLANASGDSVERGKVLYDRGEGLQARGVGGVALVGRAAACAACHHHPLDGGGEGGVVAPPLAWGRLGESDGARPGYDTVSFARALRAGVSSDGQTLHPLMPRYALDEADIAALVAYLQAPPTLAGFDDTAVRIATILPSGGPLRLAGEHATASLTVAIAEANARGTIFERTIRLTVIDAAKDPAGALDASRPALIIGSVGLDGKHGAAKLLAERGLLNFAPLVGLGVVDVDDRILSLRPTLADQALRLARAAIDAKGCVDVAAAADALSQQVEERLRATVESRTNCEALLVLAPRAAFAVTVAAARRGRQYTNLYYSADQAGTPDAALFNGLSVTYAYTGRTLADEAAYNARQAVQILTRALAAAGREPSPRTLTNALYRHADAARAEVLLRAN